MMSFLAFCALVACFAGLAWLFTALFDKDPFWFEKHEKKVRYVALGVICFFALLTLILRDKHINNEDKFDPQMFQGKSEVLEKNLTKEHNEQIRYERFLQKYYAISDE